MPETILSLLTATAALIAVLALILLSGRLARRFAPARPAGARLAIADTLALDQRRRLHLIRCDGQEVLLLTGGGSDVVVGWLPQGGARP